MTLQGRFVAVAAIILLSFGVNLNSPTAAAAPSNSTTHRLVVSGDFSNLHYQETVYNQALKYMVLDSPKPYFDIQRAEANNEHSDVLAVGRFANEFASAASSHSFRSAWDDTTRAGSGIFSGYRYCGYGNLGGTPANTLDRGCQTHDRCYASRGWGKCSCDEDFRKFIASNTSRMSTTEAAQARGAQAYFWAKQRAGKCVR